MITSDDGIAKGARNLLVNCGDFAPGDYVLIVQEEPITGWYADGLARAIEMQADELGMRPRLLKVGPPDEALGDDASAALADADHTVFLSRLGDNDRFEGGEPGKTKIMCYIRDLEGLSSPFGCTDHRAMIALKDAVNRILLSAREIDITCPLGTSVQGVLPGGIGQESDDVTVRRFPVAVPIPMPGKTLSGRIALARFLTPTGNRPYDPAFVAIDEPVFAEIENGRIRGFHGAVADVARVEAHYERVGQRFDIDPRAVHSWHAGIHPGCAYKQEAAADPDRWSNTVFGNPRFLHFHTCGDYAPGEICVMVVDHSVSVDGRLLWDSGRLRHGDFDETRDCMAAWPMLREAFDNPSPEIGIFE